MIEPVLAAGSLIAERYRVAGVIARGGMGAVHAATDERLQRPVAIKTLRLELVEDAALVRRFEREAQTAARLGHPGIAQVLDFGRTPSGMLYLVMERVQGETLSSLVKREGKLAPHRAADIVEQALGALASAHATGVVHRDLKPANLMVTPTGESRELVKVLDFGIAHLMDSVAYTRLTQAGAVLGTPTYMAPEQAEGKSIDVRTDVYAMGLILWHLLTGQKPYGDLSMASLAEALLHTVPPRADSLVTAVPSELASIAEMAMQKDPSRRFADANAMGRALASMRLAAGRVSNTLEPQRLSLPAQPQTMSLPTAAATSHRTSQTSANEAPITRAHVLRSVGMFGAGVLGSLAIVTVLALGALGGTWTWWRSSIEAAQSPERRAVCTQTHLCCVAAGVPQDTCAQWGDPTQIGDCTFALNNYRSMVASRNGDLSACTSPTAPTSATVAPPQDPICASAARCCRAYTTHFHSGASSCPALEHNQASTCREVLGGMQRGTRLSGAHIPECE